MNPQSLHKKDTRSFTEKHISLILFLLCVFVIVSVFLVAYAISEQSVFTALGGV